MGRKSKPLTPDDPRHGKRYAYTRYKCTCPACRKAHSDYHLALRERLDKLPKDRLEHGKYSTYVNYKCRCPACSAEASRVNAVGHQKRRAKRKLSV